MSRGQRRKKLKTKYPPAQAQPPAKPQAGRAKSKGRAKRRKPKRSEGQPATAPPPQGICDTPSGFREEETSRKYRDNQVDGKKLFQNLEQTPSGQRNRGSHFEKTKDQYLDGIAAAAAKRKLIKTPSPTRKALERRKEDCKEKKKSTGSGSICETCIVSLRL